MSIQFLTLSKFKPLTLDNDRSAIYLYPSPIFPAIIPGRVTAISPIFPSDEIPIDCDINNNDNLNTSYSGGESLVPLAQE